MAPVITLTVLPDMIYTGVCIAALTADPSTDQSSYSRSVLPHTQIDPKGTNKNKSRHRSTANRIPLRNTFQGNRIYLYKCECLCHKANTKLLSSECALKTLLKYELRIILD